MFKNRHWTPAILILVLLVLVGLLATPLIRERKVAQKTVPDRRQYDMMPGVFVTVDKTYTVERYKDGEYEVISLSSPIPGTFELHSSTGADVMEVKGTKDWLVIQLMERMGEWQTKPEWGAHQFRWKK